MRNQRKWLFHLIALVIAFTLILAVGLPTLARAEGETPEPPVEIQPESPTDEENPAETIVITDDGQSVLPANTNPGEPETPLNVEDTVSQITDTANDGVDISLHNNNGEVVPLASEEAATILADPQFCWENSTTGVVTCGASHGTIDAALADAYAHNFNPNEVGIIVIEAGTFTGGQTIQPANWGLNTAPGSFEIRGSGAGSTIITSGLAINNFSNSFLYLNNMTIQGGLGFNSNSNTSITLENLILSNAAGTGLTITNQTGAGGAVQLKGVISSGNSDDGADIQVQNSKATVLISDSKFSNNGGRGFSITANNNVTISNVEALTNVLHNIIDTDYGGNGNITILNSKFSSTTSDGLRLFAGGSTGVSNSTFSSNSNGSGLTAWSNLTTGVFCSTANGNKNYGFDLGASNYVNLYGSSGTGNGLGILNISGGTLDYKPEYCCSSYCPTPAAEPIPASSIRLSDLIIPVYVGTNGNMGTLVSGRNLVFHLLQKNDGSEDLLAEVKVPGYSTLSGTTFAMKSLAVDVPLSFETGNQVIGPVFLIDVFGVVRSSLTYLEGYMEIKFILDEGFSIPSGMTLAVQFFDQETNQWINIPNSRIGNTVYAYNDLIGPYALVLVPQK